MKRRRFIRTIAAAPAPAVEPQGVAQQARPSTELSKLETIVPNAVVRELTVDKKTGLVNGAHFIEKHTCREMHVKAKAVGGGASCLESTRILLNSKIANSSGVLGHYRHDQFYISSAITAVIPEAKNSKVRPGMVGGAGYVPRFVNLKKGKGDERGYLRGYAFDFYDVPARLQHPRTRHLPDG